MRSFWIGLGAVSVVIALGCGGAGNKKAVESGNTDRGVSISEGEIAVAPDGDYTVVASGNSAMIARNDGTVVELAFDVVPLRVAFTDDTLFVLTSQSVAAADPDTGALRWQTGLINVRPQGISPSLDGTRVAVWGTDVELRDASDGSLVHWLNSVDTIEDFKPYDEQHWVWTDHDPAAEEDTTTLGLLSLDGDEKTVELPCRCGHIDILPDRSRLFLSWQDPSGLHVFPNHVVDITEEGPEYVAEVPIVGRLGFSADGMGFVGVQIGFEPIPPGSDQLLGDGFVEVLVGRTDTLEFDSVLWDGALPVYTTLPDPHRVVLQDPEGGAIRIFDVETRSYTEVEGPPVLLDMFAVAPNGNRLFVLDRMTDPTRIHVVDVNAGTMEPMSLGFSAVSMNVAPDGRHAFIRSLDDRMCVFNVAARGCTEWIDLAP